MPVFSLLRLSTLKGAVVQCVIWAHLKYQRFPTLCLFNAENDIFEVT